MGERSLFVRGALVAALMGFGAIAAGCADGNSTGMPHRDAGGGMDANTLMPDIGPRDAGRDTNAADVGGHDAQADDTGTDTGPHVVVGTCEACVNDLDCDPTSWCANLVTGGRACLPGCDSEFPSCPRGFTCIFDATGTGVHANICAPVGGPCCVDEDADMYGVGVGCMGPDCNDVLATVHPGRDEICDGIDTNCNMHIDEDPNDCMSGRCSPDGDGTYSSITGGMCRLATCTSGTMTDCALYTCHDGGAMGTTCATMCAPAGTDSDLFCILTAHCDAGACVTDVPNGNTCDEDSDCQSSHCDNGFCCGSGACCAMTSDCPNGGVLTQACDDPTNCQGHHGVVTCVSNSCSAMTGVDDDTGCTTSIVARNCGAYDPIVCDGTMTQVARTCATSCLTDAECIVGAHCTVGLCIPDFPPGGPCTRNQDCQTGLSCVDNTCCMTACNGPCEACNLPSSPGTCAPVAAGTDPAGECPGFSCTSYYTGFTGGSDVCRSLAAVGDAEATCDGARACRTPDVLCPVQPPGAVQIDCNDTCQVPHGGTCTSTTAGVCDNLDGTAGTRTCGSGACMATVQACIGGVPQMCVAGSSSTEVCDGVDNNCNSVVDDGGGALCSLSNHVAMPACSGVMGCTVPIANGCESGWVDYDQSFANGCECDATGAPSNCGVARNLGPIAVGNTVTVNSHVDRTRTAYFQASFPVGGSPGRGGSISIVVSPPGTYTISIAANCTFSSGGYACTAPGDPATSVAGGISTFQFNDGVDNTPTGITSNSTTWPTTAYIQVTRSGTATTCTDAAFSLTISR